MTTYIQIIVEIYLSIAFTLFFIELRRNDDKTKQDRTDNDTYKLEVLDFLQKISFSTLNTSKNTYHNKQDELWNK